MASISLSAPPTILVSLKPLPPRFNSSLTPPPLNLLSSRGFLSPPLYYIPLRCSSKASAQFSPVISMSSNENNSEPLWKSLGKSIGSFGKKPSVEELLRQQIEKQEYYDDGGGSGNRPGGGGGGGGGDGFGGSEEEGFSGIIDETIQVVLATLGFIFMYIYIINGAEMTRLAKDYISFLFGGRKSVRLTRALYQWERFCKNLTEKKETDRYWLEKAILTTPTWFDHPDKYRRIVNALFQQQSKPSANEETSYEMSEDMSGELSDGY